MLLETDFNIRLLIPSSPLLYWDLVFVSTILVHFHYKRLDEVNFQIYKGKAARSYCDHPRLKLKKNTH